MIFNIDKNDLTEINSLLQTKENNINIADLLISLYFDFSFSYKKYFTSDVTKQDLILVAKKIIHYSDFNDEVKKIIDDYFIDSFHLCKIDDYINDPYNKTIKTTNFTSKNYSISKLSYSQFVYFPLNEIHICSDNYYKEISSIGFFDKRYEFTALLNNNDIWMCITPNEINTMKPFIKRANGNVLTIGLGLGYFAFMCSEKDEVDTITIIEKDNEIINLFDKHILPQFPHKNKIKIINGDGVEFLSSNNLKKYDYTMVDIWHNPEDGLPLYIKCLNKIGVQENVSYWLEDSMICLFRRCLLTIIEEQLHGSSDNDYLNQENDIDEIINKVYFATKNDKFNSYQEIYDYISKDSIISLIQRIKWF